MIERSVASQAGGDARGKGASRTSGSAGICLPGTVALALLLAVGRLRRLGRQRPSQRRRDRPVARSRSNQNLKEVQHRDGGVVQAIGVRQGDRVEAGQTLFWLDDVQTKAELSIIRSQLGENLGRKALA